MAREQKQGARGRFLLGGSYGEPGPGLGTLYEAWRMEDGRPVLLLRPGGDVEWRPEGPWRVCLSCDPAREDAVALDVEHSPPDAPLSELANLLVLMSASVERVEDDDRVHAHLTRGPVAAPEPPRPDWRRSRAALAGMAVFVMGLGVGRTTLRAYPVGEDGPVGLDSQTPARADAPFLLGTGGSDAGVIAYPLPPKPFTDQAVPPCKKSETVFNGGCWIALEQRPPCEKDSQIEQQGKCYMPVAKRPRLPQAVEPARP